ncbi:MAG TPA: hypothetical protein VGV85_04190 [Longimicrobiaceae bacterium]|nr:hypothetical protein [Longimicrobiaceae bacterium]
MDQPPRPDQSLEDLRRLHATLDRLVRRLTRRMYGTVRETQMDAGAAIGLLYGLEVPNRAILSSTLASLVRELGQRRPDLFRFIVTLESSLEQIGAMLPPGDRAGGPPPA